MTKRHNWRKWLIVAAASVLVLAGAAAGAVKFWAGPSLMRRAIQQDLSACWDGRAQVQDVQFNFFAPCRIGGLALIDHKGRQWVSARNVELTISGMLTGRPTLTGAAVEDVQVWLHEDAGRCDVPYRSPPEQSAIRDRIDLGRLSVSRLCVEKVSGGQSSPILHDVQATVECGPDGNDFTAVIPDGPTVHPLTIQGTCRMVGSRLEVAQCVLRSPQEAWTEPFEFKVLLGDGQLEIPPFTVGVGGGQVIAAGRADWCGSSLKYSGSMAAIDADVAVGATMLVSLSKRPTGKLNCRIDFAGEGMTLASLQGKCHGRLDDVDLTVLEVVKGIMGYLKLDGMPAIRQSDVEAQLVIRGPVIRVQQATVQNAAGCFQAARGGTFDVSTGQLDVTISASDVKSACNAISSMKIPMLSLAASSIDRLNNFRLRCQWDNPSTLRIEAASPATRPRLAIAE